MSEKEAVLRGGGGACNCLAGRSDSRVKEAPPRVLGPGVERDAVAEQVRRRVRDERPAATHGPEETFSGELTGRLVERHRAERKLLAQLTLRWKPRSRWQAAFDDLQAQSVRDD